MHASSSEHTDGHAPHDAAASTAAVTHTPHAAPVADVGDGVETAASSVTADAPAAGGDGPTPDLVKVALRRVKDPELNLNVVDLGLIYDVAVDGTKVKVDMSLTSPGCPSGPEIMKDVETQVRSVAGVTEAEVNLVWSPIWTPDRIEPRVRSYLGF